MKPWTKILPLFVAAFIAKRHLEVHTIGGEKVVIPYKGIYIKID